MRRRQTSRGGIVVGLAVVMGLVLVACQDATQVTVPEEAIRWNDVGIATGPPGGCGGEPQSTGPGGILQPLDVVFPPDPGDPPPPGGPPPGECLDYLQLDCTPNVGWNQGAACYVVTSFYPYTVQSWEFKSGDTLVVSHAGGNTWQGPMIVGGVVTAQVATSGGIPPMPVSASIQVGPRPSMSWAGSVGGERGSAGDIDACFTVYPSPDSVESGFMSGQSCTSGPGVNRLFTPASPNDTWYTASAPISAGPNKGFVYVASTTVTMQLRAQVNKRYRADGPRFTVTATPVVDTACQLVFGDRFDRTHLEVNTQCAAGNPHATQFEAFVNQIWAHEDLHLNAGIAAAKRDSGDLVKRIGPLVGRNTDHLENQANRLFNAAQDYVYSNALSSHTHTYLQFDTVLVFRSSDSKWVETFVRAKN